MTWKRLPPLLTTCEINSSVTNGFPSPRAGSSELYCFVSLWKLLNKLLNGRRFNHDILTHWGRVTHICVRKLTIIGSDNGLSPGRRQAIIWTNAEILLIRPLGTNFNEMLIEILTLSFMKMRLKASSAKWRPFCLGLNVLNAVNKIAVPYPVRNER